MCRSGGGQALLRSGAEAFVVDEVEEPDEPPFELEDPLSLDAASAPLSPPELLSDPDEVVDPPSVPVEEPDELPDPEDA